MSRKSDRASVGVAFPSRKGEEVSSCSAQPPQIALVASPGSWLTSEYRVFTWMNCTLQPSL